MSPKERWKALFARTTAFGQFSRFWPVSEHNLKIFSLEVLKGRIGKAGYFYENFEKIVITFS